MSQIEQISALPGPAPTYTNDAYMAVFNRFPLQERLALRLVCHRWKDVIEEDCAQMTTLRVFGKGPSFASLRRVYNNRLEDRQVTPPTAENGLKFDPNAGNTITLYRPAYDRVDIEFLTRLFPAVQNLALAWHFGEFIVASVQKGRQKKNKKNKRRTFLRAKQRTFLRAKQCTILRAKRRTFLRAKRGTKRRIIASQFDAILEPDILGLLQTWAPNLRQLYFDGESYTFQASTYDYNPNYLNDSRTEAFWNCLTLMAPTLEKLALSGVDLKTVPQSLVLPTLGELAYYEVSICDSLGTYHPDTSFFTNSPAQLQQLAPVLHTLRLDFENIYRDMQLPPTVTSIDIIAGLSSKEGEPLSPMIVCPSVTHIEVHLLSTGTNNLIPFLGRKYPSVKSLKVFDALVVKDLARLLEQVGQGKHGDSFNNPRREPSPIDNIEELHLVLGRILTFTNDRDIYNKYRNEHEKVNFELAFQGIATIFRGLKRLIFSMGPRQEAAHRSFHEGFIKFQARFLPQVELVFELNIGVRERSVYCDVDYSGKPGLCYLSPGCVLLGQADAPEAEKSGPMKKKQRTE